MSPEDVTLLERQGKVPHWNHALYFASLAVRTELDVLYILCGEHLPLQVTEHDKALWALLTKLSPNSRSIIYEQVQQLFDLEWDANEDVQLCLRNGERYRGIPIGDLAHDHDNRGLGLAEMRRFVDEAISEELAQYLTWLRYDRNGICQFGLVDGFVQKSDEARRIAELASLILSRYDWFGVYWEKK